MKRTLCLQNNGNLFERNAKEKNVNFFLVLIVITVANERTSCLSSGKRSRIIILFLFSFNTLFKNKLRFESYNKYVLY